MMLMKKKRNIVILTIFVAAVLSFTVLSVHDDERSSDGAVVVDTLKIVKGETQNLDVDITNSLIVEGTYSGTVELMSSNGTIYAKLTFSTVSGFELYVNSGDPYIIGDIISGSTTYFTIISGSITLGNDNDTFTGYIHGGDGSAGLNGVIGMVATIDESDIVVSGDTNGYSDIGFSVISSVTVTSSNIYTNNEDVTVSGILSNELLSNSIAVTERSDGSYLLIGSLAYIDRNGSSSIGTFFDLIVGDKNDCTHAVIIGTSQEVVTSDNIIALGGGKYLVCLSSSVSSIDIGGVTVNFSGLSMASEGNKVTPSLTGVTAAISLSGNVTIEDLVVGPSVNMVVQYGAFISTTSSSDLMIEGSLSVIGTADFTFISTFSTNSDIGDGTISVTGVLMATTGASTDVNIHSMYYVSGFDRVYASLAYVLENGNGHVYVSNSYVIDSSTTISSSTILDNSGTLYLADSVTLTNNGSIINDGGVIISDSSQFYNVNGTLDNNSFIMAYGLFTNKGSFSTKFYADVSYYNNTTTKFASIPVMLENASSGDSLILRRNVTMTTDSTLLSGVTLSTNNWKLTVMEGVTFNIYGTMNVISDTDVNGVMIVSGTANVGIGCILYVSGTLSVSGILNVSGNVSADTVILTGTTTITGDMTITNVIKVGKDPSSLPYDNKTVIDGDISLADGAMAIVYGDASNFDPLDVFGYTEYTVFTISDDTYAYEYASSSDVQLDLLVPKISGIGFAQWLDVNGNSITGIHYVGDYGILIADTTTETFDVTLTYNEGIIWIVDGYDVQQGGGQVTIPYGEHYVEIQVVEGYTGSPVIWLTIGLSTVQISPGEDIMIIQDCTFKVTGIYKSGGTSQDNSLVTILSIVIVITVVLIAVMLILLMRKNKNKDKSQ